MPHPELKWSSWTNKQKVRLVTVTEACWYTWGPDANRHVLATSILLSDN